MANISNKWLNYLPYLILFTSDYHLHISASDLARQLHEPQRSVARAMHILHTANLLAVEHKGRNKNYYLDHLAPTTHTFLASIEQTKTLNLLTMHPKLAIVIQELSKHAEFIIFGSYAKGTNRNDSDIDVLLFGKNTTTIKNTLAKYPYTFHIQCTTLEQLTKHLAQGTPLAQEIRQHHIIFGHTENIVALFTKK